MIVDGKFIAASIVAGTPLLYAILGEILTERVGKLNLGVEGMMLMGAVFGFHAGLRTGSPLAALLAAMLAGGCGALIYAVLTVTLRTNQIVTGLTLTLFGAGLNSFLGKQFNLVGASLPESMRTFFANWHIPVLGDIPLIGPILFRQGPLVYIGYVLVVVLGVYMYHTRTGLNLRTVGENTAAADAAGINVLAYQYIHIVVGGMLCGLGGAQLSLAYVPSWQDNITAGRGWIAVALVIFCKWNPYVVFVGAFLFGGLDILGYRLQGLNIAVSQYILDMLPYLVTIVIMVVASMRKSGRGAPPGNLGIPYFREEK